jgi:limonene-1,2-epoxide hydrolase
MSPCYDTLIKLIEKWQAKDVEGVLAYMDEEIVWHYAAGAMPPIKGKAMARKLLGRFQAGMHDIQWRVFSHAEVGGRLFIEGVDEYRSEDGLRIAAPYAGVLDFRDGLITGWRDYVDIGVIAQQKAGEPLSQHVLDLIDVDTAATS